jgi:dihydrofolate reductase
VTTHKTQIVYSAGVSLDGYIADVNGGVDWLHDAMVKGESYGLDTFQKSIDAVVMGSRTYEKSLELGAGFGGKTPTWVFSKRALKGKGKALTITSESPAAIVSEMSRRGLKRAWLMGGGKLASSFLAAGLLDEISLGLMPVVLGGGIPLFDGGITPTHLTVVACKQYQGGALGLTLTPRLLTASGSSARHR